MMLYNYFISTRMSVTKCLWAYKLLNMHLIDIILYFKVNQIEVF